MFMLITSFFPITCHSWGCLQTNIYTPYKFFLISLILQPLDFSRHFQYYHHGNCRLLADGMQMHHLECCYCFTTIWGQRPQSHHPWHSLRTHLHNLLLDTYQPHAMPTIWRCLIWTFCYCTECSIHPTVIICRWWLWKWFWHCWFTNSFMENSSHTPCL